jgi:hypothetical protein
MSVRLWHTRVVLVKKVERARWQKRRGQQFHSMNASAE